MGPGHLGIGLALKPAAPKVPLWILLVASEALDLLSFGFTAVGIEEFGVSLVDFEKGLQVIVPGSVPWSHGLLMSIVWSVVGTAVAYFYYRSRQTSVILGLVIFSHWLLDFGVHPPDLPLLLANSQQVGLGLWMSGPGLIASFILELALLASGMTIYLSWRKQKSAKKIQEAI